MTGGLMQLVAYGAQDVYLTGNPQITFFKAVYRRHTNFSMEAIEQVFNGQADFGKKVTCTISRNGDLIHRMYLQVTLPRVQATSSSAFFRWVNYVGHMLIKSVEVQIGGQRMDKQYGDWLNIWTELTMPAGLRAGYDNMVGNTVALTGTGLTDTEATTLYIPLQFWFCRNPGLALPLIALQYHEVKIELDIRPKSELYVSTSGSLSACGVSSNGSYDAFCVPSLEYASLYIDYIYLDTDERRRFAQTSHEYLIEQLQFTGDESTVNTNVKVKLNFNHPVKELIWVVQRDDVVKLGYNQWNNYTDDFDADAGVGVTTDGLPSAANLVFSNVEGQTNVFPFVGVGEVDAAYLAQLTAAGVTGSGVAGMGTSTAQVRPVSLPAGPGPNANNLAPTDFGAFTTAADYSDHAGFGPINAGRNPTVRAKLQLNGHDRFQERLGSYFNLVQPYQHHTNVPPTGINVYSFALYPEQHQPSGTCNFSRIDNATLQLQLTPKAALGSKVRIYAISYNVLRVISGITQCMQQSITIQRFVQNVVYNHLFPIIGCLSCCLQHMVGETLECKQGLTRRPLYNRLVCWKIFQEATSLNCGDLLRAFPTTSHVETHVKTQGNDLGHSNNGKDWTIRSQAPTCAIVNLLCSFGAEGCSSPSPYRGRVVSTRRRFRDYNKMGLMTLTMSNDGLRYSPISIRKDGDPTLSLPTRRDGSMGWSCLLELKSLLFGSYHFFSSFYENVFHKTIHFLLKNEKVLRRYVCDFILKRTEYNTQFDMLTIEELQELAIRSISEDNAMKFREWKDTPLNPSYVAGFLDGDGCIYIRRTQQGYISGIEITQCRTNILMIMKHHYGGYFNPTCEKKRYRMKDLKEAKEYEELTPLGEGSDKFLPIKSVRKVYSYVNGHLYYRFLIHDIVGHIICKETQVQSLIDIQPYISRKNCPEKDAICQRCIQANTKTSCPEYKLDRLNIAYIAGIFDAEGYIFMSKMKSSSRYTKGLYLKITQKNFPAILHAIRGLIGYGEVVNDVYYVMYSHEHIQDFLEKVLPFSIVKKNQIMVALTYIVSSEQMIHRVYTETIHQIRHLCYMILNKEKHQSEEYVKMEEQEVSQFARKVAQETAEEEEARRLHRAEVYRQKSENMMGEKHHMYGKHQEEDHRLRISMAIRLAKKTMSDEDIIRYREMAKRMTYKEFHEETGLSRDNHNKLRNGQIATIEEIMNEESAKQLKDASRMTHEEQAIAKRKGTLDEMMFVLEKIREGVTPKNIQHQIEKMNPSTQITYNVVRNISRVGAKIYLNEMDEERYQRYLVLNEYAQNRLSAKKSNEVSEETESM